MLSSGIRNSVVPEVTDISEEYIVSFFRIEEYVKQEAVCKWNMISTLYNC
jgi:hypothetical protein